MNQLLSQLLANFAALTPEVALSLGFLGLVGADLVLGKKSRDVLPLLTLALLLGCGYLVWQEEAGGFLFQKMLLSDAQARFFKLLVTVAAVAAVAHAYLLRYRFSGEWFALLLALLLGLYLLTMAVNLLLIYLSVELVSLCSYVLTAFRGDRRGAEGAVKYALFGAVSAAVMLYGMSLLYGLTGSLDAADPAFTRHLAQADGFAVGVALTLTLGGLLFKIAAAPFHFWTPDVYQAAATPVVSFFSVAPKAAAFLVLMRLEATLPADWPLLLAAVAALSLTVGNFAALWQRDARRMLAYSGIAQSGFVLLGLVAASDFGLRAATFYLATYLFASMGAFLGLDLLVTTTAQPDPDAYAFSRFKGLGIVRPLPAIAIVLVMMALVGFPLTAGFSAKLLLFSSLWETYQSSQNPLLGALLAFGLLNTVVSLGYYLKVPYLLFFQKMDETQPIVTPPTPGQVLLLAALTLPILLLFFKADWLMNFLE